MAVCFRECDSARSFIKGMSDHGEEKVADQPENFGENGAAVDVDAKQEDAAVTGIDADKSQNDNKTPAPTDDVTVKQSELAQQTSEEVVGEELSNPAGNGDDTIQNVSSPEKQEREDGEESDIKVKAASEVDREPEKLVDVTKNVEKDEGLSTENSPKGEGANSDDATGTANANLNDKTNENVEPIPTDSVKPAEVDHNQEPRAEKTDGNEEAEKSVEEPTTEKEKTDSETPVPSPQIQEPDASGDVNADESKDTTIMDAQIQQDIIQPSAGHDAENPQEPIQPSSDIETGNAQDIIQKSAGLDTENPQDVNQPSEGHNDGQPPTTQSASFPEAPPLPNTAEASAVENARSHNLMEAFREEEQTLPLSLSWTYGFNRHIGCLNLSDTVRNLVMYASSHVAVLLDFENNVQKLLLGHANAITCIDCSADKRWLVTADKGDDSSVIIWDSYTGIPVQTIFDMPGNKGNMAVAMSANAKYIITVSACTPQIVSVWDWTTSGEYPICSIDLPLDFGIQTKVAFCHNDDEQFATNSDSQVIFFSWSSGVLEYHAPFLSDDVFNRVVGTFSQTLYQLDGVHALTGTSQGNIVVWEPERPKVKTEVETPAIRKRALKLVKLQDRAITTLSFTNGYIITGDVTGAIKFYDSNLDLFSWHSNSVEMGPITSISFKYDPDFNTELLADSNIYPADATIAGNPFIVRDFLVSTKHAEIFSVHADGSSVDTILHEHDAAVHAIAVSSTKPWICIGSYAGLLKIWDYEAKQCVVTRVFEKGNNIQCLTFDALGLQLAIGMTNGSVHVLDAISLTDLIEKPFRYARDAVTHIAFSHNSKYLATADADMATTVFVDDSTEGWKYLGRYRAHYKSIKDLSFGVALDTNLPRLLTLGQDRSLVEYDLINSSKDDLRLISIDRIEQNAVPSCLAWYPDVTKESFFIMANDRYKYKLFNTTTKMCRKTLLAPTYGSYVQKMLPLPDDKSDKNKKTRLLSYITKYKVGLQILPLDGNPHKSVAVVAHPSGISHLATSHDGKYLFTAGGKDSCVHMWSVSVNALEAAASLGGEGLTPFYGLLEGGRDGELFAELENYFYFAQLRSQGLDTTETREVSTVIPLDQIPFLMRALGFYPSEQEVEDMLNEVKFSEYVETGQYVSEINLGDFIKLYVNHRPAFGLSPDEIEHAFRILGRPSSSKGEPCIDKAQLFTILQRRGEHMTEHELSQCLGTLLGVTSEGGSTEFDLDPDNDVLSKYLDDLLPDQVSATMFSDEILGLPLKEIEE